MQVVTIPHAGHGFVLALHQFVANVRSVAMLNYALHEYAVWLAS